MIPVLFYQIRKRRWLKNVKHEDVKHEERVERVPVAVG
jgi:hypothetical protein